MVFQSHHADLFPSLLSLLAPLREVEKPAQGHALVSSGSCLPGHRLITALKLEGPS